MNRFFICFFLFLACFSSCAPPKEPQMIALSFKQHDWPVFKWMEEKKAEVEEKCRGIGDEKRPSCFTVHFSGKSFPMMSAYRKPDSSSAIVGEIRWVVSPSLQAWETLDYEVLFFPKGLDEGLVWIPAGWDTFYSHEEMILDRSENWILVPIPHSAQSVWLNLDEGPLIGTARSLFDGLFLLPSMRGVETSSDKDQRLNQGSYMILKIEGGSVFMRKEIDSDMPCELGPEELEELKKKEASQPARTFRVDLTSFLDAVQNSYSPEGFRIFQPSYPKGC